MFSFIKEKLKAAFQSVHSRISSLFGNETKWNDALSQQLETLLLESEFGSQTTKRIIEAISQKLTKKETISSEEIRELLKQNLSEMISAGGEFCEEEGIYFMVGVNGTGKTTTTVKLGMHFKEQNKKILCIAADTFRAAAREQLVMQCEQYGIDVFSRPDLQDPASVVHQGCTYAHENGYSVVIIDTAGRLQTKVNLMNELTKIHKVAIKVMPSVKKKFLLTVDVTLGQNSLQQALLFNEAIPLSGLILTKFDALTKSGIVFTIVDKLKVPVAYLTYGENIQALSHFDAQELIKRTVDE